MIRQIRYFQSVVRNNSFSEAAQECHISQSAISQQIQALERELGFNLLERKNRKFVLTPAVNYNPGIEECLLHPCGFKGAGGNEASCGSFNCKFQSKKRRQFRCTA